MIDDIFKAYEKIDIEIIQSIKEDKENIELFDKRQSIIDEMLNTNIEKKVLLKLYENSGLKELDDILKKELERKIHVVKKEMQNNNDRKKLVTGYTAINRMSGFFSKNA